MAKQSFNSAFAWWYLSRKQKDELEKMRRGGDKSVGGMGPKAPYFFVQEGSLGAQSADKAGIVPKYFVQRALDEGRLNSQQIYDILSA